MKYLKQIFVPVAILGLALLFYFKLGPNFLSATYGGVLFNRAERVLGQIILIASAAFFLQRLITVFFWQFFVGSFLGKSVPKVATDFTSIVVYFSGFVYMLSSVFHKSLTSVLATSSVVGIVLGIALRAIIADIFSGVAASLDEAFKVGDWIMYHEPRRDQNVIGQIIEINWRTTRIKTEEGNLVVIPNSLLTMRTVTVFSAPDSGGRYELPIVLDRNITVEHAKRILVAASKSVMRSTGFRENPPIQVLAHGSCELGVEYRIRYWIDQWTGVSPGLARDALMSAVLHHLHQAGLGVAKPQYDVVSSADEHSDPHMSVVRILSRVDLFHTLSKGQLDWLATNINKINLKEGDIAFRKGEFGSSMFILLEGLVEVRDTLDSGFETVISVMGPGEFFGEASLLTGKPRQYNVVAISESLVIEVSKEALGALLEESQGLVEHLSKVMAERDIASNKALENVPLSEKNVVAAGLADQFKRSILNFFRYIFMKVG